MVMVMAGAVESVLAGRVCRRRDVQRWMMSEAWVARLASVQMMTWRGVSGMVFAAAVASGTMILAGSGMTGMVEAEERAEGLKG